MSGHTTAGGADAAGRAANPLAPNAAALAPHRAGHVPASGGTMAPPVIAAADPAAGPGDPAFEAVMMPLSPAERCDACLRIGGPSAGVDAEAARFAASGKPVYRAPEEVPAATPA